MLVYFLKVTYPILGLAALFSEQTSALLGFIGLAAIFGSVLTYNRIKASLTAAESAGKAWREERDAALSHVNRISLDLTGMQDEKVKLVAQVTALESRPNLTRLEELVAEATAATKNHEVMAGERTERLISAVEKLTPCRHPKEV